MRLSDIAVLILAPRLWLWRLKDERESRMKIINSFARVYPLANSGLGLPKVTVLAVLTQGFMGERTQQDNPGKATDLTVYIGTVDLGGQDVGYIGRRERAVNWIAHNGVSKRSKTPCTISRTLPSPIIAPNQTLNPEGNSL